MRLDPHKRFYVLSLLICVIFLTLSFSLLTDETVSAYTVKHKTKVGKNYKKASTNHKSEDKQEDKVEILNYKGRRIPLVEGLEEFEGDPEARTKWFNQQRAFPFKEIPVGKRQLAWQQRNSMIQPLADAPRWQSIGPNPTNSAFPDNWGVTSGRINTIAVSPADANLVIIGSATGGIWRSADGGTTFIPVIDDQVDLAVGSIAFAPSDPKIVYAGMGDGPGGYLGTGVLKSTDSGLTWKRISNDTLPAPGRSYRIQVDPNDPNRVYAAQLAQLSNGTSQTAAGFFLSTDGGINWTKTLSGTARDLVIKPNDPKTLYLAINGTIQRSLDGGKTWNIIYNGGSATKVAVTAADPQKVYVLALVSNNLRVAVSDNGGNTFNLIGAAGQLDKGQFGYNDYIYVDATNPQNIYVGTRDVYKTTDGGNTWANITQNFEVSGRYHPDRATSHPDQHSFTFDPNNPQTIYIGNDGGISKSTDSGATFQSINNSLDLTLFVAGAVHPTDPLIVYGGTQDNGTQRHLTSSSTWEEFFSGDGGNVVVAQLKPSTIFSTYIFNFIFRLTNNGDVFDKTVGDDDVFNNDRVAFYPPFTGNKINNRLYFGTYRLYTSDDLGDSWTPSAGQKDLTQGSSDTLNTIGVSSVDPNTIYTGSAQGRVMVSVNGGVKFKKAMKGLPFRTITSIVPDSKVLTTSYLTVSGFGSGHVFKTTNNGASWQDISSNLPNIPVNTLLVDTLGTNNLYIGTDIGVFRSTNGGSSWESFNNGLPPVVVMRLLAQSSGSIVALTYGRGAYVMPAATINPAPKIAAK